MASFIFRIGKIKSCQPAIQLDSPIAFQIEVPLGSNWHLHSISQFCRNLQQRSGLLPPLASNIKSRPSSPKPSDSTHSTHSTHSTQPFFHWKKTNPSHSSSNKPSFRGRGHPSIHSHLDGVRHHVHVTVGRGRGAAQASVTHRPTDQTHTDESSSHMATPKNRSTTTLVLYEVYMSHATS